MLRTLLSLAAFAATASSLAQGPPREIQMLFPSRALPQAFERELKTVVSEWNSKAPPGSRANILHAGGAGDGASTARVLMGRKLAGAPPEIALVDASEVESLAKAGAIQPLPGGARSLPLTRTLPILIINRELAPESFGAMLKPSFHFREFQALIEKRPAREPALAVSLRGSRGLWIFESIAGRPLWQRQAGGLQSNRELAGSVKLLQDWIDSGRIRLEPSSEQAIQSFLERRCPFLITSLETLALLQVQASFAWDATVLPSQGPQAGPLFTGSDLVVTRFHPGLDAFLKSLYSEEILNRLLKAGAFLPVGAARPSPLLPPAYMRIAKQWITNKAPRASRSTDAEVVRARMEWARALLLLFAPSPRPLGFQDILTQIDTRLSTPE